MTTATEQGIRDFARMCWGMFNALVTEGFSEKQALVMLGQIMGKAMADGAES